MHSDLVAARLDDATRSSRAAGVPVLGADDLPELDPAAIRMVPAQFGAAPIGVLDGMLVIAFPSFPLASTVAELSRAVGIPVRVVLAPDGVFEHLQDLASTHRIFEPMSIESIMTVALELGATDIHFAPGEPPLARIGGAMAPVPGFGALSAEDVRELARGVGGLSLEQIGAEWSSLTVTVYHGGRRLRAAISRQRSTFGVAARVLPLRVPPMGELGLPDQWAALLELVDRGDGGLVLVGGGRRSGVTTTMASVVDHLVASRAIMAVTIEDPVEYVIGSRIGAVRQRSVGVDVPSMAHGLDDTRVQDADVVMAGSLPDAAAVMAAVAAAARGVFVLAAVPELDVPSMVAWMFEAVRPEDRSRIRRQMSVCLRGAFAQQLVPGLGWNDAQEPTTVAVCESLVVDSEVSAAIAGGAIDRIAQLVAAGAAGSQAYDVALAEAVLRGDVDPDVARGLVRDPDLYDETLALRSEGPAHTTALSA